MKVFAVIGNPISHSKSPQIMNAVLNRQNIDALYTRVLASSVTDFVNLNEVLQLTGFNITAPYKKDIVKVVKGMDKDVAKLQVANTVAIDSKGNYRAYNTDVNGVVDPLIKKLKDLEEKKVMVFGAGGAARAVVWGLLAEGCTVFLTNRTMEKARGIAGEFGIRTMSFLEVGNYIDSMDVIVNTIPSYVPFFDAISFNPEQIVFDAAYKTAPLKEKALKDEATYIEGEQWLISQARHSFKHFTGVLLKNDAFSEIQDQKSAKRKDFHKSIALIGPMGAGKSVLGKELAEKLGYGWIDLDKKIEEQAGMTIDQYFETKGEAQFRKLETEVLISCMAKDRIVISCGGGIVNELANRRLLKKHCQNIFLSVRAKESIRRIKDDTRPLLRDKNPAQKANELIRQRMPLYLEVADVVVNTNISSPDKLLNLIYEDYRQSFID